MSDKLVAELLEVIGASSEVTAMLVNMLGQIRDAYPYVFKEVLGEDEIADVKDLNEECKAMLHKMLDRLEKNDGEEEM